MFLSIRQRDKMARLCWLLACVFLIAAAAPHGAQAWRQSEIDTSLAASTSSRNLEQACTISSCIRCRNERLSSFTPTEVCISCDAGYAPAADRLSCGEFVVSFG